MNTVKIAMVAGVVAAATTATAFAKSYDVPKQVGARTIDRVDAKTQVAVLLPSKLAIDYDGKLYPSGSGTRNTYEISLAGAADCGGANGCFLASFSAEKGGTFAFKTRIKLKNGSTASYKPLTCGGSCSPPSIQFKRKNVLYTIQAKVPGNAKTTLTAAANSALAAGPR